MEKRLLKITRVLVICLTVMFSTSVVSFGYSDTDIEDLINQGMFDGITLPSDDQYQESELDAELKAQDGNRNIIIPGTMVDAKVEEEEETKKESILDKTPEKQPTTKPSTNNKNDSSSSSATSMIEGINSYIGKDSNAVTSIFNTSNKVLGAIESIGTGIAILMLLYIGMKYMLVSPEGKAEYKKTAIAYAIGAAILFAAPKLVKVLMEIMQHVSAKL